VIEPVALAVVCAEPTERRAERGRRRERERGRRRERARERKRDREIERLSPRVNTLQEYFRNVFVLGTH
jgi:hypothetical protein